MRGVTLFFVFCIWFNSCSVARHTIEIQSHLREIEDALYEQLLYMGDDYIEELEDAI